MSTLSQFFGSSGGGGGEGPRNAMKMWTSASHDRHNTNSSRKTDAYTWYVPANFDPSVAMRVYVWGAGGCGGTYGGNGNAYGGGAGGLAISEITSLSAGDSVQITIGCGAREYTEVGGTSSFGSFLSATGGNSGYQNSNNQGDTTYGGGGMGVSGNIANRRGGDGGQGSIDPSSGGGGGGGSAPSPDGDKDGFRGGEWNSYSGGAGASINYHGTRAYSSECGVGGSGTAGYGGTGQNSDSHRSYGGPGGAGILGAGGSGGQSNTYSNAAVANSGANDGQGSAIWTPNFILLGGGGGGGGSHSRQSSEMAGTNGGCGGPGAGGGGTHSYSSSNTSAYNSGGAGGMLGGGGGAGQYAQGGPGGQAAGGGASGYDQHPNHERAISWGGDGLIFIQYKITF
jgi:hypothetical protein